MLFQTIIKIISFCAVVKYLLIILKNILCYSIIDSFDNLEELFSEILQTIYYITHIVSDWTIWLKSFTVSVEEWILSSFTLTYWGICKQINQNSGQQPTTSLLVIKFSNRFL